jgi:nitroreductase
MTKVDIASLGEEVPLLEGMRNTRSIRRLRVDPVAPELIHKVCEAGTFAPSGGNRQPWIFVAVTDLEKRAFIAERYRRRFHRYIAPAFHRAEADPEFPAASLRNMRAALHLADHLHEAPVLLFVAGWTRRGKPQLQALFPCIQNILLACYALGLGASLTTAHLGDGPEIDAYLGLSPETPTCALLPIGWPEGKRGRPPRISVDEKLYFDCVPPGALSKRRSSGPDQKSG